MTQGFVSYAQNFEDIRLWRAFSDVTEGRYLDIGTQDPVRDSVSLAFYERGWRGYHVEPTPAYAAAMRIARPDETVIEAAVTTAPGPIQFFEIPETGISTGIAEIAQRHSKAGWDHRVITVPTVTLAGLFDLMGDSPIHWLKIDVEGMEAEVLESWGDHPARPFALVIEATAPNTQEPTHQGWYDLVLSRGYRDVLFDGLSRYFVHETQAARGEALALSPNVFDGLAVESFHFLASRIVAEKDVAIGSVRQQAEHDHQEALAAAMAQAEARHHEDVAASLRHGEAARAEALAAAAEQAGAMLDAVRAELETRIASGERTLMETRQALAAQQQESLTLAREAGRLQGRIAAQTEADAVRLRDAEVVRRDLADRLARNEQALEESRRSGTELRERMQALIGEHDLSQLRAASALEDAKARAALLAEKLDRVSQQLAESGARHEQAERQRAEAQQHAEAKACAHAAELERLRAHIAWREDQLLKVVRLFDEMPEPLGGWPRRVATLLSRLSGRRPNAVEVRYAANWAAWRDELALNETFTADQPVFSLANDQPTLNLSSDSKDLSMSLSEGPVTSVPRLLAPHDAEFITTAYQSVLGRAPDAEGRAYYLGRLRAGTHKLEILRQLRRSAEGRSFIPGVAGLDRAIRRYNLARFPVLGILVRWLTGEESDSQALRRLRSLSNGVSVLIDQESQNSKLLERIRASISTLEHQVEITSLSSKTPNTRSAETAQPPNAVSFGSLNTTPAHAINALVAKSVPSNDAWHESLPNASAALPTYTASAVQTLRSLLNSD